MPMTVNEVVLPAMITVGIMIATKLADGFFTRWQSRRQERVDQQREESKQKREDRLRAEKDRDDWREKYYKEKEDNLALLSTCQDHEKRLAEAVETLDRRKHNPTVEHLNSISKKRKTDP